jgi:citrate/tricarballylate utilization protein
MSIQSGPAGHGLAALVSQAEAEVDRVMVICNACRYCEGFCAVFPAMTRRLEFARDDVHYLANLCHNCGACLHACQYAPPHEFAVNVPRAMAKVRLQTYTEYAWPPAFGGLYRRNGLVVAVALAAGLALFMVIAMLLNGTLMQGPLAGNFYAVFPHNLLVALFGAVFLAAIVALGVGAVRFWRACGSGALSMAAAGEATSDVLRLKYLDGGVDGGVGLRGADSVTRDDRGGDSLGRSVGCNDADDTPSQWRRTFHHVTFYGFLLCFASTCVATVYHYAFAWPAPYPLTSLPVVLGTVGGIGLLVGPAGLAGLNLRRHPLHGDPSQKPMDLGFLALLFLTSLTGLALLAWRDTDAMALLLALHLGVVMALFLTMPYGKFAHGIYRSVALLKWAVEKREPSRLKLGSD